MVTVSKGPWSRMSDEEANSLLDSIAKQHASTGTTGPRWMHAKTDKIDISENNEFHHQEGKCKQCNGNLRIVEMVDSRWWDCKTCGWGERI